MRDELIQQAKLAVAAARKSGAQGARASVTRKQKSTVEWRDGKLDKLQQATSRSLGLALYVDGRYSANQTSDLRPDALSRFVSESVALTRLLARDAARGLADPARYADRFAGDLELNDPKGAAAMTPDLRRRVAAELEASARSAPGGGDIISATGTVEDVVVQSALVCSNGMEGTRAATDFALVTSLNVKDAGDRKQPGWWWADCCRRADLPEVASIGREATRRAVAAKGSGPTATGVYPCIIENVAVGRLLRGLTGPLSGSAIQQKRSFLADLKGKPVASSKLTLVDDPLLPRGLSSRAYDGEGMSTLRRPIIEAGVLRSFYLDTYYARKLKLEPTSGSSTNLTFAPGKRDLQGLLSAMGKGVLVTGFIGGNSNSATGDFSYGIRGFWVEGGKPVRPLSEMNLSGNQLSFWKRLVEVGNDPFPYSSKRTPSLLFDQVDFSGA